MLRAEDFAFMAAQMDLAAPAIEEPITFLRYAGVTPGRPAAGVSDKPVYDPPEGLPLTAVAHLVTLKTEDQVGGRVADGAVVFQIRTTVLVDQPRPEDRIIWAGAAYKPIQVTPASLGQGFFWVVRCDRQ